MLLEYMCKSAFSYFTSTSALPRHTRVHQQLAKEKAVGFILGARLHRQEVVRCCQIGKTFSQHSNRRRNEKPSSGTPSKVFLFAFVTFYETGEDEERTFVA